MRLPTLYQFFRHQVQHGFHAHGLADNATIDYVSDMLTRFAQTQALHAVRDADGRPIEYIVDLLARWQEIQAEERSWSRERLIARYLGEYTLFMSGLFRERLRRRGELEYYRAHGATGFWRSADYEANPVHKRTYRRLYRDFGPISDALDHLRRVQFPLPQTGGSDALLAAYWRV